MPNVNMQVEYVEDANKITVKTFRNRRLVTVVTTEKRTGLTITEVYKEGVAKPVERYVYNRI